MSIMFLSFKVLELRQAIAAVIISLIEENGPGKSQVAKVIIFLVSMATHLFENPDMLEVVKHCLVSEKKRNEISLIFMSF